MLPLAHALAPRNRAVISLLSILELPFLLTCLPACQRVSMKMEVFENLMLRGVFYTALGVGGYLISSILGSVNLSFTIGYGLLVVDGLLYLVGYMRDEGVAPSKYNPQADTQAVGV